MGNFLPEGYDKIPSTGRYMKLLDGRNVFRILSSAITAGSTGTPPASR